MPMYRSLLYVPAHNKHFLSKVTTRGADAIVLDLEDGVASSQKSAARTNLPNAIEALAETDTECFVRINAPLRKAAIDLEAAVQTGLDGVVLPKISDAGHLAQLDCLVSELEQERGLPAGTISFLPLIETAQALVNASHIAAASPRNHALSLGAEDYCTDVQCIPSPETLAVPNALVLAAGRAAGLRVYGLCDTVAALSKPEATLQSARTSRAFGFDGAFCVHPDAVSALNEGFLPSRSEIERANRILAAAAKGARAGKGAVRLEDDMIDAPVVLRAKALLARAARFSTDRDKRP